MKKYRERTTNDFFVNIGTLPVNIGTLPLIFTLRYSDEKTQVSHEVWRFEKK